MINLILPLQILIRATVFSFYGKESREETTEIREYYCYNVMHARISLQWSTWSMQSRLKPIHFQKQTTLSLTLMVPLVPCSWICYLEVDCSPRQKLMRLLRLVTWMDSLFLPVPLVSSGKIQTLFYKFVHHFQQFLLLIHIYFDIQAHIWSEEIEAATIPSSMGRRSLHQVKKMFQIVKVTVPFAFSAISFHSKYFYDQIVVMIWLSSLD